MDTKERKGMLTPFRCLDLTDEKGFFCGRVLADLGADVIKIEKPGGDTSRNIGPFFQDDPDPEKSLYWFAYNANKRGITLDIETADGSEIFKRLVKGADFVIESFPPGHMDELGLGYSALSGINPRIIVTSITPFGQSGPYKDYKGSDIVCMAMGGFMALAGDPDRPPVRISSPQAFLQAGAEAAVGSLTAHYPRETTGEGQHVDVSIQESIIGTLFNMLFYWDAVGKNVNREGMYRVLSSGGKQMIIWPCKDGYVSFAAMGGRPGIKTNRALVAWMASEGMAPDYLKEKDWEAYDYAVASQEEIDSIGNPVRAFFETHTLDELCTGAMERDMMFYPVSATDSLVSSPQLSARDYWETVEHPELNTSITYPGSFYKSTEPPCGIYRRAPLIGEHNREIYEGELGLSREELLVLKQAGVI